jgi:hypothetical protein
MKTTAIFLATMMFATAAFAGLSTPVTRERDHMKYGRSTPTEEARTGVTEFAAAACCNAHRSAADTAALTDSSGQQARFSAKSGRMTPQAEADRQKAQREMAAHVQKCVEIGQCSPMTPTPETAAVGTPAPTDTELRLRAKYGITSASQAGTAYCKGSHRAALHNSCEHDCCKQCE